jgi:hypothetical protein
MSWQRPSKKKKHKHSPENSHFRPPRSRPTTLPSMVLLDELVSATRALDEAQIPYADIERLQAIDR